MCRLLRSQQSDNQKLISLIFDLRIIGSTKLGLTFHPAWPDQCLPLDQYQRGQQIENSFQNSLWPFQVLGDAFWIDQRTDHVPKLYQQDPSRKAWYFCDSVPWWHLHLHQKQSQKARRGHLIDVRIVGKAFVVHQIKKAPISLKRNEIPTLHHLSSRYLDGRRINQGRTWLV